MNQQSEQGKAFTQRDNIVVSFCLDDEILSAINKRVGNSKGKRSQFAREVFRQALNL
jgi:hypothetical protein